MLLAASPRTRSRKKRTATLLGEPHCLDVECRVCQLSQKESRRRQPGVVSPVKYLLGKLGNMWSRIISITFLTVPTQY